MSTQNFVYSLCLLHANQIYSSSVPARLGTLCLRLSSSNRYPWSINQLTSVLYSPSKSNIPSYLMTKVGAGTFVSGPMIASEPRAFIKLSPDIPQLYYCTLPRPFSGQNLPSSGSGSHVFI